MRTEYRNPLRLAFAIAFLLLPIFTDVGCQHVGPGTIVDDRLAYNNSIVTSWEQQALLNIVRARYDDLVGFVNVDSMAQTHTLTGTTQGTFSASILPWNRVMNTLMPSLMGTRTTTDSPLITYTPQTNSDFIRNLNVPIKPVEIFSTLIESNYNADALLNLTLYSVNDINNVLPNSRDNLPLRNNVFRSLTRAIECAHIHGDLSFYTQAVSGTDTPKVFLMISDRDSKPCQSRELLFYPQLDPSTYSSSPVEFIRETLHLRAAANQFEIVAATRPMHEDEIAVRTRSVIAAIRWLSNYVEPTLLIDKSDPPLIVKSDTGKPRQAFSAVRYRSNWYWIPQGHTNSQFSLIYLRTLLALADTSAKPSPPILTIPTR